MGTRVTFGRRSDATKMAPVIGSILFLFGCSSEPMSAARQQDSRPGVSGRLAEAGSNAGADEPSETTATAESDKSPPAALKPLTEAEQEHLLRARCDGRMAGTFGQVANMFLVFSRIQLGAGVGLMTESREIAEATLQPVFPTSYSPTLREFLDAIALQTSSEWKYDPSSKYFESDVDPGTAVEGLAIFEFTRTKREKPFELTLAEGWKAIDNGHWVMHVPPAFPVGMDIYEMGTYSSDDKLMESEVFDRIRSDVALEWARRVNAAAGEDDLTSARVGEFDALYYESMIPSTLDQEIKWRQWVFMDGHKCYFIVSTILPELEPQIFPDVEKMLASFRIKDK